jgi:hypothetical protein
MEKFVKILLEGIQNSIVKNHRYPWLGLDDNHHLKMVFEPGTSVQRLKDLEQGLIKFSEKNGWDKDIVFSKDDSHPYKRYTIHLEPESLHQLLLKQSPSYKQQGFLLSILYPERPMAKADVLCLGPCDPELKRFLYGKSNILDLVVAQLDYYLSNSQYDHNLIFPFIQKHIGFSESEPFSIHPLHPHCQMVPLTEDAKFIYAEKTGLAYDDLDQLVSLEIPLQSFISSYIPFLNEHLESLEKEYIEFVASKEPSEQLNHLHSELHSYEQCMHQLQQDEELKALQKSVHEIDPCVNHIGLFFACHKLLPERLQNVIDELPHLSNITADKQEQLMNLYQNIIDGDPNAYLALINLQADLFKQKTTLTEHIQKIQQHLLLPIIEHLQTAHTDRSLFANQSHAVHYDQQRLKSAVASPAEIPRIIEHIHKEMNGLSQTFKENQQSYLSQIEKLKTQINKLEGLLLPSSPQVSLKF